MKLNEIVKNVNHLALMLFAGICLNACKEEKKPQNDNTTSAVFQIVTSADYPPFEFYKDGQLIGFEIDLINHIAKRLNKTLAIQDAPFESLIASIQAKRADACISALSATDERRKTVDFSNTYHISQSVIVTLNPQLLKPEDFKNKTVGVQMGSTYETFVKEWQQKLEGLKHQSLSKVPDLLQNLKIGRIDGIVMGIHEAKAMIRQIKDSKQPAHIIEMPETTVEYAIALPKNSPYLKDINEAIESLKADGTIDNLMDNWFKDLH